MLTCIVNRKGVFKCKISGNVQRYIYFRGVDICEIFYKIGTYDLRSCEARQIYVRSYLRTYATCATFTYLTLYSQSLSYANHLGLYCSVFWDQARRLGPVYHTSFISRFFGFPALRYGCSFQRYVDKCINSLIKSFALPANGLKCIYGQDAVAPQDRAFVCLDFNIEIPKGYY